MLKIRKATERGLADHGWLLSKHTFSFANYHDPKYMGFSVLRVINEDQIEGGSGFDMHTHHNMEIISFVIDGALEHQDSMGNKTIIRPGEIQRMSAGTGVRHSEYNHLPNKKTHFLQIWILPDKTGYPPSYEQINFESKLIHNNFVLLASPTGREESITLHQDVEIYLGRSHLDTVINHKTDPRRSLWIQIIHGTIEVLGEKLLAGDGAAIQDVLELQFKMSPQTEFLLFDMLTI